MIVCGDIKQGFTVLTLHEVFLNYFYSQICDWKNQIIILKIIINFKNIFIDWKLKIIN